MPRRLQPFIFASDVLDGHPHVREAFQKQEELPLVHFGTNLRTGHHGALESVSGGQQLVQKFEPAHIPDLFVEAANDVPILH